MPDARTPPARPSLVTRARDSTRSRRTSPLRLDVQPDPSACPHPPRASRLLARILRSPSLPQSTSVYSTSVYLSHDRAICVCVSALSAPRLSHIAWAVKGLVGIRAASTERAADLRMHSPGRVSGSAALADGSLGCVVFKLRRVQRVFL